MQSPLSICFHSIFGTDWPLTVKFACELVMTIAWLKVKVVVMGQADAARSFFVLLSVWSGQLAYCIVSLWSVYLPITLAREVVQLPLSICLSVRLSVHQHLSYDVHLKARREDSQNCFVLFCVWQLGTINCTHVSSFKCFCVVRYSFPLLCVYLA